jgi:hypothetical protein
MSALSAWDYLLVVEWERLRSCLTVAVKPDFAPE